MFDFLKRTSRINPQTAQPDGANIAVKPPMTYKAKLVELHDESIALQKKFLDVVAQIRENGKSGEAIDEVLLYNRDQLYKKFNRVLNMHRRLRTYADRNNISVFQLMPDDIWTLI
jgi:hypothetical protein